jgi:hypothetical protein
MSLKRFAVAGLLAAAFIAVVCLSGGCEDGGNPNKPDGNNVDAKLVGDWQLKSFIKDGQETADKNSIVIYTYKATGEMAIWNFRKAGDFWIEDWKISDRPVAKTSRDTLYMMINFFDIDMAFPGKYTVSGNTLTLSSCASDTPDESCVTAVYEKVNFAALKSGLGTVYSTDTELYISTVYSDLMWYLQQDEDRMLLDFDQSEFYGGEYYFGDDYYTYKIWYTNGSRLFLTGMNLNSEIKKTVELEYKVTGSGNDARLSIRPVLPDGTLGPEDIWIPTGDEDLDWERDI